MLGSALAAAGCSKNAATGTATAPAEALDAALTPAAAVAALRRAGGGHLHAVTTFKVSPQSPPADYVPELDAVTTTTDLWMDSSGQFRLVELNDRDGGREVVFTGRELAVSLRYGKMIRRSAQEPEPTHLLEEALGGPFATWDLARPWARVAGAGPFTIALAGAVAPPRPGDAETPLRKWRDTVKVGSLGGEVKVDPATHALLAARLEAQFSLTRDGAPFVGLARAEATLSDVGRVAAITPPQSEELRPRQRTIVEERALLGRGISERTR